MTGGDFSGVSLTSIGLLYGLAATFCYSLTAIFGRIATGDGTPLSVASYNFLFATIFLLFFKPWATVADPLDPRLLAAGFGLALIPTALAYILYFTGVSRIAETSRVPVIASVDDAAEEMAEPETLAPDRLAIEPASYQPQPAVLPPQPLRA